MVFGMNKWFFDKIYFYTVNNKWAEKSAVFVSEFSKPAFIAIYIAGIITVLIRGGQGIAEIMAVPLLTLLFNSAVRKLLNKPRPFNRADVNKLVDHKNSGSFPSNHACSSMIISFSYFLVCGDLVPVFVVFAFFTGLSRIMTGVHYPLDVFCGWLVGILSGLIFFVIL